MINEKRLYNLDVRDVANGARRNGGDDGEILERGTAHGGLTGGVEVALRRANGTNARVFDEDHAGVAADVNVVVEVDTIVLNEQAVVVVVVVTIA